MDNVPTTNKVTLIKNIYFYLVSFVALMMVVFSMADAVNIALKAYIFTKADNNYYSYPVPACDTIFKSAPDVKPLTPAECAKQTEDAKQRDQENLIAQRQRDVVRDISFVVVGLPLFILHWMVVRKKD